MKSRTKDLGRDPSLCLCLAIQRAGRAVGRRYDDAFRSLDLTNWQFSLLSSLGGGVPKSIGLLAGELGADRTTMTANLKPLERRGLVEVSAGEADRRVRLVTLSETGSALLADARGIWAVIDARMTEDLDGLERGDLLRALGSLSAV